MNSNENQNKIAYIELPGIRDLIKTLPDYSKTVNVEKLLSIEDIKKVKSLALNRQDLEDAKKLITMVKDSADEYDALVKESMVSYAMIMLIKCFKTNASRISLNKSIYTEEKDKNVFKYIENMRNKHIAHDENWQNQVLLSGLLNKNGAKNKIGKLVCVPMNINQSDNNYYDDIINVIDIAAQYSKKELKKILKRIKVDVEEMQYEDLEKLDEVEINIPSNKMIEKKRKV